MSFKWKCACCGKRIVVPYPSPKTMSSYSTPYCNDCFANKIEICEDTGEFYKVEDENKKLINWYSDIDGMIFECEDVPFDKNLFLTNIIAELEMMGVISEETYHDIPTAFKNGVNLPYENEEILLEKAKELLSELK